MTDLEQITAEVEAEFRGPGCEFETAVEEVLGERHLMFANRHRSVGAMLAANAERWGDRDCLVLHERRISYKLLAARVAATAERLRREYSITKGDRVAILAANCPEWVITFYAATSLGAVVAALNGWWTTAELRHAISLTAPKLVVGDTRRLQRAGELDAGQAVLDLTEHPEFFAADDAVADEAPVRAAAGAAPANSASGLGSSVGGSDDEMAADSGSPDGGTAIDEDDPALILFTSGTTGRSKGATISHRGLVGFVDGVQHNTREKTAIAMRLFGIDPAELPQDPDVHLLTAPLFHVSGLFAGILNNMRSGATMVFREGRFDAADVLRLIEKHRVTHWTAIGAMAPAVLDHPDIETRDLSSIKAVATGGAHFSEHMRARIAERFPQTAPLFGQGYGSSETVGVVCTIGGPEFAANPLATGRANLGFEIEIRDERDRVQPDGTDGHVHVRSAYTMLGYWGDDAATEATIKTGRWLDTGDWGCVRDGLLFLNARARDMIIRSGENIYPTEIEQRLDAHPAIAESAVIGVEHPDHGQEVKAVVVPADDPAGLDTDALAAWCAETLAAYKVPVHWEIRDEPLPRNATGKIVKAAVTGERELSGHTD